MIPLILLLASAAFCSVVHVGAMALAGWLTSATVEEVGFFIGPVVTRFRFRGVNYRVDVIPLGGWVKFKGDQDKPKISEEILFAADVEPPGFFDLHPLRRIAILASGCAAQVVLAVVCLGPWASVRSLGRGFVQLVPFAPWTPAWVPNGGELADRLVALFRHGPLPVALGVLAAKLAASNLLPLPPLNGGMIVTTLLGWRKGLPERVSLALTYMGMLVVLILLAYWLVQFLGVLLGLIHGLLGLPARVVPGRQL
jgi:membrane-associated protease RseP (regulator of RpoE activity)